MMIDTKYLEAILNITKGTSGSHFITAQMKKIIMLNTFCG